MITSTRVISRVTRMKNMMKKERDDGGRDDNDDHLNEGLPLSSEQVDCGDQHPARAVRLTHRHLVEAIIIISFDYYSIIFANKLKTFLLFRKQTRLRETHEFVLLKLWTELC